MGTADQFQAFGTISRESPLDSERSTLAAEDAVVFVLVPLAIPFGLAEHGLRNRIPKCFISPPVTRHEDPGAGSQRNGVEVKSEE